MNEKEKVVNNSAMTYLTFTIGEEIYGLDIDYVTQIINILDITKIPGQPNYVKGVINLRGQIVPVMEVRAKFKRKSIEYDDRTCIIVLSVEEMTVGLIVDSVSEVVSIEDNSISDVPELGRNRQEGYLEGFHKGNNKVVAILNCAELIKHEE
ncbi:MAG: chemotaxis protein CheW [Clostridiales bacterium]|nr:MAG: chemotaxis protein CheW [Clostridiales bacterium]